MCLLQSRDGNAVAKHDLWSQIVTANSGIKVKTSYIDV